MNNLKSLSKVKRKKINPVKLAIVAKHLLKQDLLKPCWWEEEDYEFVIEKNKKMQDCFRLYLADGKPENYSIYFNKEIVNALYVGLFCYLADRVGGKNVYEDKLDDNYSCLDLLSTTLK